MAEFSFDDSGMVDLTRDLEAVMRTFRVEVDRTMVDVGNLLSETAKMTAREAGSASIPGTVRPISAHGVAEVRAGSADVPLAALWELGNRGRRKGKAFKHPVFARKSVPRKEWTWTGMKAADGHVIPNQPRHRFMSRARRLARPMVSDLMLAAVDRSLRKMGGRS